MSDVAFDAGERAGSGGTTLTTATILRRGLLALVALGVVGTASELAFLGHWGSAGQTVVWPALVLLAIATVLVAVRASPTTVRIARVIAIGVAAIAFVGVWFHVSENLTAGPLDGDYAAIWASMSLPEQWWLAITGGVGPAPTLAPGVLLQLGLALLLATVRHPAAVRAARDVPAAAVNGPNQPVARAHFVPRRTT
jgi:hypothetical protein